jgi:hypothetical protein
MNELYNTFCTKLLTRDLSEENKIDILNKCIDKSYIALADSVISRMTYSSVKSVIDEKGMISHGIKLICLQNHPEFESILDCDDITMTVQHNDIQRIPDVTLSPRIEDNTTLVLDNISDRKLSLYYYRLLKMSTDEKFNIFKKSLQQYDKYKPSYEYIAMNIIDEGELGERINTQLTLDFILQLCNSSIMAYCNGDDIPLNVLINILDLEETEQYLYDVYKHVCSKCIDKPALSGLLLLVLISTAADKDIIEKVIRSVLEHKDKIYSSLLEAIDFPKW